MKTIEEKAKAYDEARERFKSFKEKYYTKDTNLGDVIFDKTGEMQKDFEGIFPELHESEDERIRKKLLALVKWSKSYAASGVTVEDANEMTAHLEKQEQKPLSPDEKMNHPLYLEGFEVGRKVGLVLAEKTTVPAEGLEEEIYNYANTIAEGTPLFEIIPQTARHFAQWQKEQMMKEAVEVVVWDAGPYPVINAEDFDVKDGDKVRIIIVKEDK